MELINGEKIAIERWNRFVSSNNAGSIEQTSAWAVFNQKVPGRSLLGRWAMTKNEEIVAAVQVFSYDCGFAGKKWAYGPRGPVGNDKKALKILIDKVKGELRSKKMLFWRLDPAWGADDARWELLENSKKETTSFFPTDSLHLDLQLPETELLQQMKRKGRYNINLATKKGVKINKTSGKNVTKAQLQTYLQIQQETTSRDGFAGHDAAFFSALFAALGDQVWLFESIIDGKVVAGAVLTLEKTRAVYYFGVSSSDRAYRPYMAPYLLQWAMILHAKEAGATDYDFTGIVPADLEPKAKKRHAFAGITQFKERFGGHRVTFSPGREIVLQKGWYAAYKLAKWARNWLRSVK